MKTINDNILYIADLSLKIVAFNEAAKKAFPSIEIGKECPEATNTICRPGNGKILSAKDSSPSTVFIKSIFRMVNFSVSIMEYPGHGKCYYFCGTFYKSLNDEILSRLNAANCFSFALDMNLTKDRYVFLTEQTLDKKIQYPEEPLSKLLKRTCATMVHPDDHKKFWEIFDLQSIENRLQNTSRIVADTIREKGTRGSWDEVTVCLIPEKERTDGEKHVFVFFIINYAPADLLNKTALEKDKLTGLFTKESFCTAAKEFLSIHGNNVCIISMDVEHFRFFNKWYSRWQGDRLIKSIAYFLHEMDRLFDTVSGYAGGDDFFIMMDKHKTLTDYLTKNLSKLVSSFDGIEGFRMVFGGYEIKNKSEDILDAMDYAMTASNLAIKKSGTEIKWYSSLMVQELEYNLQIIPEIEKGLEEDEFTFYLQPKCSLSNNKIVGAEALVRWNNKLRGLISPAEFIPALEKCGDIMKLDVYIWEQVCKTIRKWIDNGKKPVPVSINVSRIDIFSLDVPTILSNLIDIYKISPKLLEIEITESAFIDDTKIIKTVIQHLHDKGFTILIDDFGSGYSSLNMLKDVQADILKMDIKFFALNNTNYEKGVSIIKSVLELSRSMNLSVIAEGVETAEQISLLKGMGLNYVQGFYYYKPIPIEEYESLLADQTNISHDGVKFT